MEQDFRIVDKEICIIPWQVYATFECLQDCQSEYATFFDIANYKAHKGDYIRVRINKNKCPTIGRKVNMEYLIEEAIKQNIFR